MLEFDANLLVPSSLILVLFVFCGFSVFFPGTHATLFCSSPERFSCFFHADAGHAVALQPPRRRRRGNVIERLESATRLEGGSFGVVRKAPPLKTPGDNCNNPGDNFNSPGDNCNSPGDNRSYQVYIYNNVSHYRQPPRTSCPCNFFLAPLRPPTSAAQILLSQREGWNVTNILYRHFWTSAYRAFSAY